MSGINWRSRLVPRRCKAFHFGFTMEGERAEKAVKSHCGHFYVPPSVEDVRVFKIFGPKFIMLNRGTWHAGPIFRGESMDFYNLELSDTNVVDHTVHDFIKKDGKTFEFDE